MTPDRLVAPFAALIRRLTARIDYLALYPAQVVAQNADLTLELQPEDQRLPSLSAVPIRHGLPGVTVKVAAGARVLLAFEGGDPSKPVATLWDSSSVEEIVFAGGTREVARKGDEVALDGAALPPSGLVGWITQVTAALNGLVPGSVTATPSIAGRIDEGNPRLKA